MIAASEPLEFVPHGRTVAESHPKKIYNTKSSRSTLSENSLLYKLTNFGIKDDSLLENPDVEEWEWWCDREVYARKNEDFDDDTPSLKDAKEECAESSESFRPTSQLKNEFNFSIKSEIMGAVKKMEMDCENIAQGASRGGSANSSSNMSKKFNLNGAHNKSPTKPRPLDPKTDSCYEEELYVKGCTAVWSKVFDTQKARLAFVQAMAELATRSSNIECLERAGVLELLRPFLSDPYAPVRQCTVIAVGKMAEQNEGVARQLLDTGMVTLTLDHLNKYNVYYKSSALYLLRAVAKHNEELASGVVQLGALEQIVTCLEDFDTQVKENSAWALGYIGKHNEVLAGQVVDAGSLPLLLLAFQEPELTLKQIAACALVDLSQYKPEAVVDSGAICHLIRALENQEPKLKRSILCCLSAIAGARAELAEAVVAGGALPPALLHVGHDSAPVRLAAVCLIWHIVKHSVDLAQLIVNTGGCGPLVERLGTEDPCRVPACMALGFIARQSDQLAMAVIETKTIPALVNILQNPEAEDLEVCAVAWTLGHIAKHSPQHSLAFAVANAFPRLLQLYTDSNSSAELRVRACRALKQALQCCLHRPALEPLLHAATPCILKYVLAQYAKILPNDARARRRFVFIGALYKIQEIDAVPGSSLMEYINIINSCFPEEIVRFFTPGYPEAILE